MKLAFLWNCSYRKKERKHLWEFCLFQNITFMLQNIISQSENKFKSEHLNIWEETNKKWEFKPINEKQTYSITPQSRNDLESGCLQMTWKVGVCHRPQKHRKYSINCTNNYSKIRAYTVLHTLSGDCNFEISGLRYCKRLI